MAIRIIDEAEFKRDPVRVMKDADAGIQTSIVNDKGEQMSLIGMSNVRTLPDPDLPDLLNPYPYPEGWVGPLQPSGWLD